jgi:hypothetical protein
MGTLRRGSNDLQIGRIRICSQPSRGLSGVVGSAGEVARR